MVATKKVKEVVEDNLTVEADEAVAAITVAAIEAMSVADRKKVGIAERAAVREAKKAGTHLPPTPVTDWINNPVNAANAEKASKKSSTPRGKFAVIPYPANKQAYDLEAQMHVCAVCKVNKRIREFPTTTPDKRTEECRVCRNTRQNRSGKAEAGTAYVAKTPEAEVKPPEVEAPAPKAKADSTQEAPKAPQGAATKPRAPRAPKVPVAA